MNLKQQFLKLDLTHRYIYSGLLFISIISTILFIMFVPYLLNRLFFFVTKKQTIFTNKLTFSSFVNYEDTKFQTQIDNIFKKISFYLKNYNIFVYQIIREGGEVNIYLSSNNSTILNNISKEFSTLEGAKLDQLTITNQTNFNLNFNNLEYISKVSTKGTYKSVEVTNNTFLAGLIETLKSFKTSNSSNNIVYSSKSNNTDNISNTISGVTFIFKNSKAKKRFLTKKKELIIESNQKDKIHKSTINKEKIEAIENKTSHSEIFTTKIYTYSNNKEDLESINSNFNQIKNTGIKIITSNNLTKKLFNFELNKNYINFDHYWIKSFLNYSYLNSFEISKLIQPTTDKDTVNNSTTLKIPKNQENLNNQDILLELSNQNDKITIKDSNKNIMIFGDPDSGKSAGLVGNAIESIISKGYGALFTTYKQEESYTVVNLAKKYNRESDLIIINPQTKWRTNIIQQELENSLSINNLITKIEEMNKLILRKDPTTSNSGDNEIWDKWANELNRNILKLTIYIGKGKYQLKNYKTLLDESIEYTRYYDRDQSETNPEKVNLQNEQRLTYNSFKSKIDILKNNLNNFETITKSIPLFDDKESLEQVVKYFESKFVSMIPKQRESIYSMVQVNLDAIKQGYIGKILLSDEDDIKKTFKLSDTRKNKLIVLDLPASKYSQDGRVFQEIFKLFWQDSMKVYDDLNANQSFIVSDEFQEFGAKSDVDFSSINRSANVGMIFATQNYSSLEIKLGEVNTKKLLGNFQTKFFFQTSDKITWQYARELLGEVNSNSYSNQLGEKNESSILSNRELELLPSHFQELGMRLNDNSKCEAIVFKKGFLFNYNQKNYLKVVINKIDKPDLKEYLEILESQKYIPQDTKNNPKTTQNIPEEKAEEKAENMSNNLLEFSPNITSKEDVNNQEFITIKEAENIYKISDRYLRKKINEQNITTKEITNQNNRIVKTYNKKELDNYLNL